MGYFFHADKDTQKFHELLIASPLVYSATKKDELWRLFTYSLIHSSHDHLIPNMVFQVLSGAIIELQHGSLSVFVIYSLGVITGKTTFFIHYETFIFCEFISANTISKLSFQQVL